MEKNIFAHIIATALSLQERAVANTLALLEEGCTIPFISRYRKERTGGLDEVQIAAISDRFDRLQEIPTCPTNPSGARGHRWPENKVWNRWHNF